MTVGCFPLFIHHLLTHKTCELWTTNFFFLNGEVWASILQFDRNSRNCILNCIIFVSFLIESYQKEMWNRWDWRGEKKVLLHSIVKGRSSSLPHLSAIIQSMSWDLFFLLIFTVPFKWHHRSLGVHTDPRLVNSGLQEWSGSNGSVHIGWNLLEFFCPAVIRLQSLCCAQVLDWNMCLFVVRICRRFEEPHVGQMKTVFPEAYTFRQEKNIPTYNNGIKKGSYQLTVEPALFCGS